MKLKDLLNESNLNFNSRQAIINYQKEVKGNYLILTPPRKESPETVLHYSKPSDTASVKTRILKMMKMDEYKDKDIHFGRIKWSSKENDKVLSFTTFQRGK